MKGRFQTDTVDGPLGSIEGAPGLTVAAFAIRGMQGSDELATDKAAVRGVCLSLEPSMVSTEDGVPVPESCWITRRVSSSVAVGSATP